MHFKSYEQYGMLVEGEEKYMLSCHPPQLRWAREHVILCISCVPARMNHEKKAKF